MTSYDFQQELAQWDDDWREQQEKATAGGKVLEAGHYQARVVISRVERSDWDDLTFVTRFEDVNGAGIVTQYDNLAHDVGRSIAAGRCKALGYEGPLSGLPQACADGFFDDLIVDIAVKDKPAKDDPAKIYKVVYVNRLHGRAANVGASGGGATFPADSDDIPFAPTWA